MRFLRLMRLNGEPILVNPDTIAYVEENHTQTCLTLRGVESVNGEYRWPAILWVQETLDVIENKLEGYELLGESEVRFGDE